MEEARWADEDRIDRNMLSDEDHNESHESCSNDFLILDTQESTSSEPRDKRRKSHGNKNSKLQKRMSKIG